MDRHEMSEQHRALLMQQRVYLLHNLRPGEEMWSGLISRGIVAPETVEEIKFNRTPNQQIGSLLNILPSRGPNAFDDFCDVLLECDHGYVAECLKTTEVTDQFREDIRRNMNVTELPEELLEKFVGVFKKSTPQMQRFAERKFEVWLEGQENDRQNQEDELRQKEQTHAKLQLEVDQLRTFCKGFVDASDSVASCLKQEVLSKHLLAAELRQIKELRDMIGDTEGNEDAYRFYANMETVLSYLEKNVYAIVASLRPPNRHSSHLQLPLNCEMPLPSKVQNLATSLSRFVREEIGDSVNVPGAMIKNELQKVISFVQEIHEDVIQQEIKMKELLHQHKAMNDEVLALIVSFQERRQLECEVTENKRHISELIKSAHVMKNKTKDPSRELKRIKKNQEDKKTQLKKAEKDLEKRVNSAEVRVNRLIDLIPNLGEDDVTNEETDLSDDAISIDDDDIPRTKGALSTPKKVSLTQGLRGKSGSREHENIKEPTEDSGKQRSAKGNKPSRPPEKVKSKYGATGSGLPFQSKMREKVKTVSNSHRGWSKMANAKIDPFPPENPHASEDPNPGSDSDCAVPEGLKRKDSVHQYHSQLTMDVSGGGQKREHDNISPNGLPSSQTDVSQHNLVSSNPPHKILRQNRVSKRTESDTEDDPKSKPTGRNTTHLSSGIRYQHINDTNQTSRGKLSQESPQQLTKSITRALSGIHYRPPNLTPARQTSFNIQQSNLSWNDDDLGDPLSPQRRSPPYRQALRTCKIDLGLPTNK